MLLVTAQHVVGEVRRVQVAARAGTAVAATVLDSDADLDVALLRPEWPAGAREAPAADAGLIPRRLSAGARPCDGDTFLALRTDDPDSPRLVPVRVRTGTRGDRRVQFEVPGQREGVRAGYSGGPVIEHPSASPDAWLLGIVRARDETTVDVLDNAGAGWFVPTELIAERFSAVAELVETPIERGTAWTIHWEPRARGVATSADLGDFVTVQVSGVWAPVQWR